MTDPILFAPLASREFGERVAAALGAALALVSVIVIMLYLLLVRRTGALKEL